MSYLCVLDYGAELTDACRDYGSGYFKTQNQNYRGTAGLDFPFIYWPIVWGTQSPGDWSPDYLYPGEVRASLYLTC